MCEKYFSILGEPQKLFWTENSFSRYKKINPSTDLFISLDYYIYSMTIMAIYDKDNFTENAFAELEITWITI